MLDELDPAAREFIAEHRCKRGRANMIIVPIALLMLAVCGVSVFAMESCVVHEVGKAVSGDD